MNKHAYRLVFNVVRGQLVPVAEIAISNKKNAEAEASSNSEGVQQVVATYTKIATVCLLVLGAVFIPHVQAQVVAYRNAPASQQPTVLQTSNGVLQVNVQTPSAAGVSHNLYSQFDVSNQGVILNNSRTNVQTQLSGWIQANPWLATGPAKVILNEVVSNNPSLLNGYVEVAGKRAEVVIANPSGISVNGGGFINASRVTLTTGDATLINGSLTGINVSRGLVSVDGNGLDTRTADYTDILARAVSVNAGIWGMQIRTVTGANQIDTTNLAASPQIGTGATPSFALDVSQLGGMYAGKIYMVGTEAGVGVRNAGTLGATAGDLILQANGLLTNAGNIQATQALQLQAADGIDNQAIGQILSRIQLL